MATYNTNITNMDLMKDDKFALYVWFFDLIDMMNGTYDGKTYPIEKVEDGVGCWAWEAGFDKLADHVKAKLAAEKSGMDIKLIEVMNVDKGWIRPVRPGEAAK